MPLKSILIFLYKFSCLKIKAILKIYNQETNRLYFLDEKKFKENFKLSSFFLITLKKFVFFLNFIILL